MNILQILDQLLQYFHKILIYLNAIFSLMASSAYVFYSVYVERGTKPDDSMLFKTILLMVTSTAFLYNQILGASCMCRTNGDLYFFIMNGLFYLQWKWIGQEATVKEQQQINTHYSI
ncbi:uncharacterized protein LOC129720697 [Wyeomyia smithii]|uniref:uncharacterized protein LOC129720697 n=1 Tax=Wyeomyia smithii TaxID=174621 RepID=UPI0024681807|nr:uncharacterized protein LOC129720697 [Wyeomyia smithii]